MRHMFVSWSKDFKHILGIRRGTWLSSYSELYFTFTLSALGHGLCTYAMPHGPRHTFYPRFWTWFKFMFFQTPAIHLEYLWVERWWFFVLGWIFDAVYQFSIGQLNPFAVLGAAAYCYIGGDSSIKELGPGSRRGAV